jgi:hypothetical protein
VIHQARAVAGPVKLRDAFQIRPRLSAEDGDCPDADVRRRGGARAAYPHRDQRRIRREPDRPDVRVDELTHPSARQVVELAGAHLRHPDVYLPVPIRKECDEPSIPRDGRRMLCPLEVCQPVEVAGGQWALPEVVGALEQPHTGPDRHDGCSRRNPCAT